MLEAQMDEQGAGKAHIAAGRTGRFLGRGRVDIKFLRKATKQ